MKPFAPAVLIFSSFAVAATLPASPLEPVYHQLFNQRGDQANGQLIAVWPRLNSEAQRQAWKDALNVVVGRQCGKDLSPAAPEWLADITFTLMQRDMPLNRIYRMTLSGKSPRRDLKVTLGLPDGKQTLANLPVQYEAGSEFRGESEEFNRPLGEGVYWLTVSSGGQEWRQPLALQGLGDLTQIQLHNRALTVNAPQVAASCPRPWLEQTLLDRTDYSQIWGAQNDSLALVPWPSTRADNVWATVAVVRAEKRGSVTIRFEHRLAGPLATMRN